MGPMASQITSLAIVYTTVYSDQGNNKAPRHWPLCGEFTGDQWIPRKMFPFDDIIMEIADTPFQEIHIKCLL